MPTRMIAGPNVPYALISFDDRGREREDDPEGGVFSRTLLQRVKEQAPTHVFLFSHGWKGDVPSAIEQYDRWIGAMWRQEKQRAAMGSNFSPFFIGLHWPSQPWGEETIPAAQSFDIGSGPVLETLINAAVAHFGGGPDVRRALETIFHAYQQDPAARVLPDDVTEAYRQLGAAVGFSAGGSADGPPDQDGAPLDPQAAVRAERAASAGEAFGVAGSFRNGILAGLRQVSFWMMKHRARTVGEQGMHAFLTALQHTTPARVHLMGHSFGCIVVSSILNGPQGASTLARPVDSAVLVQGAMSLWSFADRLPGSDGHGYFRGVLARKAVAGPIVNTQSTKDQAVGLAFPAAVGLVNEFDFATELPRFGGIGSFGIQGTSIAEPRPMLEANGEYGFQPGRIYNLEASNYIGGHSAIDGPEVAHTLWQAVSAVHAQRA